MRIFPILFLTFLISSCKTNYALFQPGSSFSNGIEYHESRKKIEVDKLSGKAAGFEITKPIVAEVKFRKFSFPPLLPKSYRRTNENRKRVSDFKNLPPGGTKLFQKKQTTKKKKKPNNRFRKISSNVFIGIVFLGIAIGLALLNLEGLSILFGIASVLFLFFGLKKVFKRKRFKNIFK